MVIDIRFDFHHDLKIESDQNLSPASGGEEEEKYVILGSSGRRPEAHTGVDGGVNLIRGGAGFLGAAAGPPRAHTSIDPEVVRGAGVLDVGAR
jgi:hypothetical protein